MGNNWYEYGDFVVQKRFKKLQFLPRVGPLTPLMFKTLKCIKPLFQGYSQKKISYLPPQQFRGKTLTRRRI